VRADGETSPLAGPPYQSCRRFLDGSDTPGRVGADLNSSFRILVNWRICTLPFGMLAVIWSSPPVLSLAKEETAYYASSS
jgi:hypothetical protein